MRVGSALKIMPLNIGFDGVILPGSACERYSSAHPGGSVREFLMACADDLSIHN